MGTQADRYEPGKFNKPRFEVIERNRHTGVETPIFSGEDQAEAKEQMRRYVAKLTPKQKEEFEYLFKDQEHSYRILGGPDPTSSYV